MKILFLPTNTASMPAHTAVALNSVDGYEAKVLCLGSKSKYQSDLGVVTFCPTWTGSFFRNPFRSVYYKLIALWHSKKLIDWADVVHYNVQPVFFRESLGFANIDLKYAKFRKKKIFVDFVGSDTRRPNILSNVNKYYAKAFTEGYEYSYESEEGSYEKQKIFSDYGAIPVNFSAEMALYIFPDLFQRKEYVPYRINVTDFNANYPSVTSTKPIIVHAPSAKVAKGSKYINQAIQKLKLKYDLEYIELHNMEREEVLKIMANADIFVDQLILGHYASAALEAMSFGKPVVCHMMDALYKSEIPPPLNCAVVNANPDTIEAVLEDLIKNPEKRNAIGKQSRTFVEEHHDVNVIVKQLIEMYKK
jgi:glycosyltransferase involved in cell wall biosynthesis